MKFSLGLAIALFAPAFQAEYTPTANPAITDESANPVLTPDESLEWILGDPSVVTIPGCPRILLGNEIFHGILQYVETDSATNSFAKTGTAVHTPGSVRPFTIVSGPEIFLFYEQYTLLSLFKNSSMQLKKGTVTGCDITWEWGSSTVLAPTLEWEKIGTERVGNPFVYQHPTTNKFMMYYSASSVHLEDSDIDEPIYLGAAVADRIEGPYTRVSDEPLVVNGIDEIEGEKHMGIGSLKFIRGLGGDGQQTTWALLNRVSLTTATGHTGSTISLVTSDDEGKSFTIEDTTLIAPPLKMDGGWKDTYVYGFDTAVDPDDDDFVKVYYNARDGYAHASEAIGVSRLSKSKVGGGARDESSPPTPTPACQANLCHLCVPDERGGAGTCCDETNSCVYDKVFKEYICLPDYEWIC